MVKSQQFFNQHRQQLVILTSILLILAEMARLGGRLMPLYQLLMAVAGLIGLAPILLTAISSLQVRLISIDVLVSIAVIGALIIGEFNEAAIVTWLFMLGEVLENFTLKKTRSAVKELASMAPQTATVIDDDGRTSQEDVDFLDVGTKVLVKTGSRVPVDGQILAGQALLNEASITGEAQLVPKQPGDVVFAGTMLENGTITVKTIAAGDDSTFGKIIELVETAQDSKTKTQRFIDHFAQYYTPLVLVIAVIVGLVTRNFRLAITVMVLGCPGALVIGVPASTVAGIGNGAKHGILFKGSEVMDPLRHVDTIAFDKTGTLTSGQPSVKELLVLRGDRQTIIDQAVAIEQQSDHPLAHAISQMSTTTALTVTNVTTTKGKGLSAVIGGHRYLMGNLAFAESAGTDLAMIQQTVKGLAARGNSVVIFTSDDGKELAIFAIQDQLRPQAKQVLKRLRLLGIKRLVMLTGDNQGTAAEIASQLPVDEFYAAMLPEDKANWIQDEQQHGHQVAFVGDGINDGPALSAATVAIAMGSGTDVAMDVADLVLVHSQLKLIPASLQLAQQTMHNVNENILLALLTVLLLFGGLFSGYIEMASGMFIHELSILIVILNSMRLITFSPKN